MHTVVLGWFGGSAVWFIPLLWRLVKSVLPGGAGLRGPGTIRLWLGFACVLIASCTLEASLLGIAGVNGFGHALAAGLGHLLGHIGTPLAALALLLISLPWLLDFRWRDFAAWADGAFGLGLSRGLAKRDEEARRHRTADEGPPSHGSPATNTMAPKNSKGRYARPTVWRPPASGRAATAGTAGVSAGKDATAQGASTGWRANAGTGAARASAKPVEPVLRTGSIASPRPAPSMQTQTPGTDMAKTVDKVADKKVHSAVHNVANNANSPFAPTEPVAPAGWLRASEPRPVTPSTGAAGILGAAGAASATSRDGAAQAGRRSLGEQRPAGTFGSSAALAATAAAASGVSARAAQAMTARSASGAGIGATGGSINAAARGNRAFPTQRPADAAAPLNRGATPRQPFPAATRANGATPPSAAHRLTPDSTRPPAVTPPESVQDTLRSIAENAARWTDMAGVSLARNRGADEAKITEAVHANSPLAGQRPEGDVPRVDDAGAVSADHAPQPLQAGSDQPAVVPEQSQGDAAPVELTGTEAAAAIDASAGIGSESVAQWPTEPPVIHAAPTAGPQGADVAGAVAEATAVAREDAAGTSGASAAALAEHAVVEPLPVGEAASVTTPAAASAFAGSTRTDAASTPFQRFAASLQDDAAQEDVAQFEDESTETATQAGSHAPSDASAATLSEPVEHLPVAEDTTTTSANTPGQTSRQEESAPEVKPADTVAVAPTQPPTPVAEIVIDKALVPWDSKLGTVVIQHAVASSNLSQPDTHMPSSAAMPPSSSTPPPHVASEPTASPEPTAPWLNPTVSTSAPSAPSTPAVPAVPAFAPTAPAAPTPLATTSSPATLPAGEAAPEPAAPPSAEPSVEPSTERPAEPAVERPPLRGHTPVNGFEFHAPAASMVELPTLDLLAPADTHIEPISDEKLRETGQLIEQRLQEFKVPVTVVGASAGPVITRFEVEPALGVRGSQIVGLMKDLSRGLGLTSIRVVETIPGKTCMGLELPNAKRQTIRLSEILEASVYQNSPSQLTLAMGKDITGHPVVADLAKAPHMLVAGTTGSGKSVAINAMICSLLFKATPEEVRLIMIDPKMLELSVYEGIPHLLAPVVTDMKLAANALNWCVGEMEKRYRLMSAVGVRNLAGFNQKIRDTEAKGKKLGNPFSLTPDAPEPLAPLPLIVVVIDELADLMMVAGKKIEELIARLAQKARAAGIHLILATQRPSVDVITGLIKANIPTRVAFQVSSKIDSRTILDQMGAESLLGQGDMLFLPPGTGYPQRVHGAFVADEEVHAIVEYLKQFGEPQYEEGILDGPATDGGAAQDLFGEAPDAEADPLYDEAVAFVVRTRRASISSVQRQLRIGYNRAARLVEQMETAGLVSAMSINGSREVLAPGPAE